MNQDLQKEINETFNELDNIIFSFTDEQLNTVPFEGSWTAGEVADHIIKSLAGISRVINGPVEPTERPAYEKVAAIRDLFLNFVIKMKSPDFILPSSDPQTKDVQLAAIEKLKGELLMATEQDVSLLCTAAEFPTVGKLTRLEWINFYIVHTERHTQQIKNIFKALK